MIHLKLKSSQISNVNNKFIVSLDGKIKQFHYLFMYGPGSSFNRPNENIEAFNLKHKNCVVSASELLKEGGYTIAMPNENISKLKITSFEIQSAESDERYSDDIFLEFKRSKKELYDDAEIKWLLKTKLFISNNDIQNIIKYLNQNNQNEIGVELVINPNKVEKYVKRFSTGPNFLKPDNDEIYYGFRIDSEDIDFEIYFEFQGIEYLINNY